MKSMTRREFVRRGAGCALGLNLVRAAAAAEQAKPESLFDGKTFKGWEGNQEVFRIEDGSIVGGSLKSPVAHNDFLCTTERYSDFELTLKVRLLGSDPNAGIQIRSERIPND
ncbi:MAG: DUF1080 domain-containing protein, partial [Candidatus Hydrogenedentes bacterium]|nr:DUF1080 domain-containing protein [Candidatus Hydrogenedentota bacterium]